MVSESAYLHLLLTLIRQRVVIQGRVDSETLPPPPPSPGRPVMLLPVPESVSTYRVTRGGRAALTNANARIPCTLHVGNIYRAATPMRKAAGFFSPISLPSFRIECRPFPR